MNLKHKCCTLGLLLSTQFEMLAPLQSQLRLCPALSAFQPEHHFLRSLCFLVEHGLCLTTITLLFPVITTLSLGNKRSFTGFVLGHLVHSMLAALLPFAIRPPGLWYVHHGSVVWWRRLAEGWGSNKASCDCFRLGSP